MAEQVVEDVGLDDVFELFGRADPVGHRELAVGQQREEGHLRNQPRHGHDLPARGAPQVLVDVVEARDALFGAQARQHVDERLAGQTGQQGRLAFVEPVVGVVILRAVGGKVLRAGVVIVRAAVVAARRTAGLAIDDRCLSHDVLLVCRSHPGPVSPLEGAVYSILIFAALIRIPYFWFSVATKF
ncbi:hypothetical protein SDC9_155033 [bioreactor metagenome]|uniref:Uncharacterized protein n=1 Tax=bioreactor metagenome TaxID=1076179 RepID=A0A645F0G0_9ZZZZ